MSPAAPHRPKVRHRPGLIIFITLAVITCLALAYWQWSRWESAAGSYQNLGYALQWPAFGFFFVYIYRRFIQMEAHQNAGGHGDAPAADTPAGPTEIPEDFLPNYRRADSRALSTDDQDDDRPEEPKR